MQESIRRSILKIKRDLALLGGLLLLLGLLFSSDSLHERIRQALSLCYTTVIPAIFPFMAASAFFIRVGGHRLLGKLFSIPAKLLFGADAYASCPIAIGFICGYPVGASSAAALYDRGELTKKEFERLLTFINNPGSAFVIGGVGIGIYGSAALGRILYFSVVISAVIAGILSRFIFSKEKPAEKSTKSDESEISFSSSLTSALSDSALNMLNICACVVFFSVPAAMITERLTLAPVAGAVLSGLFEICGGVSSAAASLPDIKGFLLVGMICSWSGFSVHLQVISVCRGRGISFIPYIISKSFQAALTPLIIFILLKLTKISESISPTSPSFSPIESKVGVYIFAAFIFSLLVLLICRHTSKKKHI